MEKNFFSKGMWVSCIVAIFFFVFQVYTVHAQDSYPTRPITLIVGFGAGGATDLTGRILGEIAGKILGQPIAVVNKPGGTSSVALSVLMAEKPDGYTIGIMPSAAILISFLTKVAYDPVKDFTLIMQYGLFQDGIAVRSDSPWKTFKEFVEYAKNNPGKIRYASAGAGTPEHLIMERFAQQYGIKWLHLPYEGDAPANVALLGGHVDAVATSSGGWKPHVDSGKFRLLATFHEKRMSAYPDVPTLVELGYGMRASSLIGIAGPKGLPKPIVTKLHDAFKKSMEDSNFIATCERIGVLPFYRNAEDMKEYIQSIMDEDGAMIKKLGLRK
jgi:tripartite-type tricarboxylate transporter receptor subunit TctC